MSMRSTFEFLLRNDPDNKNLRLAYAEWLEEQGRDDEAEEQRRLACASDGRDSNDSDGLGCGRTCG